MTTAELDRSWQRERAWLGYAGLTPFLLGVVLLAGSRDGNTQALATDLVRYYAAVIASFLGAVHWGTLAMAAGGERRARLAWGVTPALVAWVLLVLSPAHALIGFAALFVVILGIDRWLLPILDECYRRLRLQLTLVVVATLIIAASLAPEAGV